MFQRPIFFWFILVLICYSCENNMDSNNSFYTEREIEGMHKDFEGLIQKPHFIKAMRELNQNSKIKRKHLLTLIDFSKPSIEKRLYVLDLKNKKRVRFFLTLGFLMETSRDSCMQNLFQTFPIHTKVA